MSTDESTTPQSTPRRFSRSPIPLPRNLLLRSPPASSPALLLRTVAADPPLPLDATPSHSRRRRNSPPKASCLLGAPRPLRGDEIFGRAARGAGFGRARSTAASAVPSVWFGCSWRTRGSIELSTTGGDDQGVDGRDEGPWCRTKTAVDSSYIGFSCRLHLCKRWSGLDKDSSSALLTPSCCSKKYPFMQVPSRRTHTSSEDHIFLSNKCVRGLQCVYEFRIHRYYWPKGVRRNARCLVNPIPPADFTFCIWFIGHDLFFDITLVSCPSSGLKSTGQCGLPSGPEA